MGDEGGIERRLRMLTVRKGGLLYKFVSPGNNGVPDRVLVIPRPGRWADTIFVETKTQDGRLSAIQRAQQQRMRRAGAIVHTLVGMEQVDGFVDAMWRGAYDWDG